MGREDFKNISGLGECRIFVFCKDHNCVLKDQCYRYKATPNESKEVVNRYRYGSWCHLQIKMKNVKD